jgi:hypothetical protein
LIRTRLADLASSLKRKRILHCFGDSHVQVFAEIGNQRLLPRTWFEVEIVGGATALGLANPNSQTRALPIFEKVIRSIPKRRRLLFMLGEVDCGFVVWYLAQTRGSDPEEELDRSIGNYVRFVEQWLAEGRSVIVAAAPPPTILDAQDWGEVANLRRVVTASLEQRTKLTTIYNARLREWARGNGCSFLDYESHVLDPTTGVVAQAYRNPNPLDHHLVGGPFARLLSEHLRAFGFS